MSFENVWLQRERGLLYFYALNVEGGGGGRERGDKAGTRQQQQQDLFGSSNRKNYKSGGKSAVALGHAGFTCPGGRNCNYCPVLLYSVLGRVQQCGPPGRPRPSRSSFVLRAPPPPRRNIVLSSTQLEFRHIRSFTRRNICGAEIVFEQLDISVFRDSGSFDPVVNFPHPKSVHSYLKDIGHFH